MIVTLEKMVDEMAKNRRSVSFFSYFNYMDSDNYKV